MSEKITMEQAESSVKQLAREMAAAAWCTPTTSHKVMDVELANAFADMIYNITQEYYQMLDEGLPTVEQKS